MTRVCGKCNDAEAWTGIEVFPHRPAVQAFHILLCFDCFNDIQRGAL